MRYLPHTPEDVSAMLQVVGADNLEALFAGIPADCRCKNPLDLPPPLSEWDLRDQIGALSRTMATSSEYQVFMGAGSYAHFIPAVIGSLLSRSEFLTAYTPYQPELSQGTLQTIFEYQTLTTRLLGMEVANASMYDGASALAEALLMALRSVRGSKNTVAVSRLIHPLYRQVVDTYLKPTEYRIIELPYTAEGLTDLSALDSAGDLAAVALQSPNFFGCIELLSAAADRVHALDALLVATFTEPLAFGLYKSPGSQGADIACGEGQSLGIPQSYGGPGLGMFAARRQHVRNMPGRLVGQTLDREGRRGYVLTLATREQHIRRERATSNICSNQALCATAATMYMACLGGTGMRQLARLNYNKAEYLKAGLVQAGRRTPFSAPTFNEFVLQMPAGFDATRQALLQKRIVAGLPLADWYPELADHYLFCATEIHSRTHLDALLKEVTA